MRSRRPSNGIGVSSCGGGRILVPTNRIAYVEIGAGTERRVGFGAIVAE